MGFINVAEKTISAKLVYYGIGMGGKTTSLQAVHGILCPRNEVQLVSINTEEDATLLFDFLPINLGTVEGFKIRIQGLTVPGQPKYRLMRKYVLSGADAVVFVVDSESSRLEENLESLAGLMDNLKLNGLDPNRTPMVVQYNKRDLDDILTEETLDQHFLLRNDIVAFPTVATESQGVFEAFVHAAGLLVEDKVRAYGLNQDFADARTVADGARRKLWDIRDEVGNRDLAVRQGPSATFTMVEDEGPGAHLLEGGPLDRDIRPETNQDRETDAAHPLDDVLGELDGEATASGAQQPDLLQPDPLEQELFGDPEPVEELAPEGFTPDWSILKDADFEPAAGVVDPGDAQTEAPSDEPLIGYELKEESGVFRLPPSTEPADAADESAVGGVFSAEELDAPLGETVFPATEEESAACAHLDETDEHLLDKSVRSNLELVERFGELDQYRAVLERRVQELVKVAQNAVHDLNKPLSAIRLMLSTLDKGYLGELQGKQVDAVRNGLEAAAMMDRLIHDLLDSSRLDHDGIELHFEPVDMNELVDELLRGFRFELQEQDVHVEVGALPVMLCDRWAMTRCLLNLMSNALQYGAKDRQLELRVWAEDRDDGHMICVGDNGIGIPEQDMDRLFRRFERGSNVSGRSGTGLGLHIVKEIVVGHGGLVQVDSTEGAGTAFKILLPFEPVQAPHSHVSSTLAQADL